MRRGAFYQDAARFQGAVLALDKAYEQVLSEWASFSVTALDGRTRPLRHVVLEFVKEETDARQSGAGGEMQKFASLAIVRLG